MYAVVKKKREPGAEITTVDPPKIKGDEVLVEVKAASICGTDVHVWDWNEWAQSRITKVPLILGHEVAGVVVEAGSDVTTLQEGDMVSAETHIVDGTCYQCQTDRMHVCQHVQILGVDRDGVFAEYVALPERNAWKNDLHLDPAIASIQEPLGNAVQCVLPKDHVEDVVGKNVAVLGCGPIGLMAVLVLKTLGAAKIFATGGGRNRVRMELGRKLGADMVLNAREGDVVETVMDATGGNGVDVALEMSGAPSAVEQAFQMVTPGGRVCLFGLFEQPVKLDLNDAIVFKAVTVYGISGRRMFQTWYQVKGLVSRSDFRKKIASIITHRMPIKDITEAMEIIHSKQAAKVVLGPRWE